MIPNHYITKCKVCSTVIDQLCAECKEKLENPGPVKFIIERWLPKLRWM